MLCIFKYINIPNLLLKTIFTYFLLFLFSIQSFEVLIITLNFKLNRDFYEEICENRDKPEMHCNGKCHLKKQIQESRQKESSKETGKQEREPSVFVPTCKISHSSPILYQVTTLLIQRQLLPSQVRYFDIFHPPRIQPLIVS